MTTVIWATLPALGDTEVPWRFLEVVAIPWAVLTSLAMRALVANAIEAKSSPKRSIDLLVVGLAGGLIVVGGLTVVSFRSIALMTPAVEAFHTGQLTGTDLARTFHAKQSFFLPRTGVDPTTLPDQPPVVPLTAGCSVSVNAWDQAQRLLTVEGPRPCELGLRTYYFPGWRAENTAGAGGCPVQVRADGQGGRILLSVPAGESEVRIWFASGAPTRLGAALSLGALIVCAGLGRWRTVSG